jgi:hypothetical protein
MALQQTGGLDLAAQLRHPDQVQKALRSCKLEKQYDLFRLLLQNLAHLNENRRRRRFRGPTKFNWSIFKTFF